MPPPRTEPDSLVDIEAVYAQPARTDPRREAVEHEDVADPDVEHVPAGRQDVEEVAVVGLGDLADQERVDRALEAPHGQADTQVPQPLQRASLMTETPFSLS